MTDELLAAHLFGDLELIDCLLAHNTLLMILHPIRIEEEAAAARSRCYHHHMMTFKHIRLI